MLGLRQRVLANTDRSTAEPSPTPGIATPVVRHDFGYRVTVPAGFEIEYAPSVTMLGGSVVYITPRGNVFFISFGDLNRVKGKYAKLDDYAKSANTRIPSQGDLTGRVEVSGELTVCGHRGILSNVQGSTRSGAFTEVWVVDLWCDKTNRYYSIYAEPTQRQEFPYFPRFFSSMAESLVCHGPEKDSPRPGWYFGDVGFSPRAKLWFLQLFDYSGMPEMYQSREVIIKTGTGVQYQWPQRGPKPMWHIRERIFPEALERVGYDDQGNLVIQQAKAARNDESVPDDYDSITYAYSLSTAKGFLEFRDEKDAVIKRIDDRWIAVENLSHRTSGTYPSIRLRAERKDIGDILVTATCIVVRGKDSE
jgi:hypothetical protein